MLYDKFSMVTSGCAEYAATHATWRYKHTYLAGRPKSIICHLAENNDAFATLYPEVATFEPMIAPAGDHPEYPSGSSAIYSAFAQAADDWFFEKFGVIDASKNTGTVKFTIPADVFYWQDRLLRISPLSTVVSMTGSRSFQRVMCMEVFTW